MKLLDYKPYMELEVYRRLLDLLMEKVRCNGVQVSADLL